MLSALAVLSLAFQVDLSPEAFRAAVASSKFDIPTKKVDAGINRAFNILIETLRRANPSNSEVALVLRPYEKAVAKPDQLTTDFGSIGAHVDRQPGRIAIDVRIGGITRLRVFDTQTGKAIPMPGEFNWRVYRESEPTFLPGGKLLVNGTTISAAGMFYTYEVTLLTSSKSGYHIASRYKGEWILEEKENSHMSLRGSILTLNDLDETKSFFTASSTAALRKIRTIDISGSRGRLLRTERDNSILRFVDTWMYNAVTKPKTAKERAFRKVFDLDQMLQLVEITGTGPNRQVRMLIEDFALIFRVKVEKGGFQMTGWELVHQHQS